MSKKLSFIVKRSIKAGYLVSNNEGLRPTDEYYVANKEMQNCLKTVDEFVIKLWRGKVCMAEIYIVNNGSDEDLVQDYDCVPAMEKFMETLL